MAITDIRATCLDILNEVRIKRGLRVVETLDQDSQVIEALGFLNDVVAEIADYGDWDETLVTANTSTQSSVKDYSINYPSVASAMVIKSIKDVYFGSAGSPLMFIRQEEMRLLDRSPRFGEPRQYTIYGTDTNGNPILRVTPTPAASYPTSMGALSIRAHTIPPMYVAGQDEATIVPFNARLVVQGLLAACILDEEGGSPTDHYTKSRQVFDNMLKSTYGRFKSNSGRYRRFVPGSRRFRRTHGA
jgi:hypothetical protein